MNYRSVADLNSDIRQWIPDLPSDLDLIAGIPRSGLLAATLLAVHLNLPITDVKGLCEGRIIRAGSRLASAKAVHSAERLKVLILDDSVNTGTQMQEVQSRLALADLEHELLYGAVYVTPRGHRYVDYWREIVDRPRVFEWNLMHHKFLSESCVDIDGVLCRDPTPDENDDGERYREFLISVDPWIVPSRRIGWLVTCRLEKYRKLTEAWLESQGVEYEHLIMMDLPDKETRVALGNHASFKADVYRSTEARLFIESSSRQAREIAEQAGRPVYCLETVEMIHPGTVSESLRRGSSFLHALRSNPIKAAVQLGRSSKASLRSLIWRVSASMRQEQSRDHGTEGHPGKRTRDR